MRFSGEILYQRRLRQNMSRADLAHAIRKVSNDQVKATERGVRGWEKNEYVPNGGAVPAIAGALGCEIEDLYSYGDADQEDRVSSGDPVAELFAAFLKFVDYRVKEAVGA